MPSFNDNDVIQSIVGKQVVGLAIHNESPHVPGVTMVRLTLNDNSALVLSVGGVSSTGKQVFVVDHIADIAAQGQVAL